MSNDPEAVINACRAQISEIDAHVLSLVKKRQELSKQISRAKRELSFPDRDFSQEKIVFENAKITAAKIGLPVISATNIQKAILEDSLSRQEEDRIKNSLNAQKSVLVIGGSGRLGQWLCRFFSDCGHTISVVDLIHPGFDCTYAKTLDESAHDHDLIVVATPIRESIGILDALLKLNLKKPTIFDVSSVKAPIYQGLIKLKESGAKVTSLHPMFGPGVELLFGKHIIRTSLGDEASDHLAHELFKATSLTIVDMSIDEHDELISFLLSLAHLINIVFIETLHRSPFSCDMLERFSSTTFINLLATAKKVMSENPHLYFEIQALNPHTTHALDLLKQALHDITKTVQEIDEDAFVAIMKQGQFYLTGTP